MIMDKLMKAEFIVFYGSASGLSTVQLSWTAEQVIRLRSDYGFSVSTAGDINGDGYS